MLSLPTQALVPPPHLYPGRSLSPARTIVVPRGRGLGAPGQPACYLDLPPPSRGLSLPRGTTRGGNATDLPRHAPRALRTRRVLTCEGLRGTLPTFPTHPPPPSQRSRGKGALRSPPFSDPNARPFLTGLPPSRRRATPPSPCRGAAWAPASSRWRRRGRARHGVHRGPAGGRGRAGAAPGRGVQTGRGRHP